MLQALLLIFVGSLVAGGLTVLLMLLMEPCDVLGEILADRLRERFSRDK